MLAAAAEWVESPPLAPILPNKMPQATILSHNSACLSPPTFCVARRMQFMSCGGVRPQPSTFCSAHSSPNAFWVTAGGDGNWGQVSGGEGDTMHRRDAPCTRGLNPVGRRLIVSLPQQLHTAVEQRHQPRTVHTLHACLPAWQTTAHL